MKYRICIYYTKWMISKSLTDSWALGQLNPRKDSLSHRGSAGSTISVLHHRDGGSTTGGPPAGCLGIHWIPWPRALPTLSCTSWPAGRVISDWLESLNQALSLLPITRDHSLESSPVYRGITATADMKPTLRCSYSLPKESVPPSIIDAVTSCSPAKSSLTTCSS